jgi:RES domain-containing protein
MILYRFSPEQFSSDISGEGARRFGGRWNSKGKPVVYSSLTISLSLLELLIHSTSHDEIIRNFLTTIEVPAGKLTELPVSTLKKNWITDEDFTRYIGDEFLGSDFLLMKVPSAIIPQEFNMLINPFHRDFKKVKIKTAERFMFDARLFKTS